MQETVDITVRIVVDLDHLAKQVAALTDDAQAQLICRIAERLGPHADTQARYIGRHLRECECSTAEGRSFVAEIYSHMCSD